MMGMDASTGKLLSGSAHLDQSLENVITTLIQTLVLRRDYGSSCASLKDKRLNSETIMRFYSCVSAAIRKWEPRLILRRLLSRREGERRLYIDLYGDVLDISNNNIRETGVVISVPLFDSAQASGTETEPAALPPIRETAQGVVTYTFAGSDTFELPAVPNGRVDVYVNGSRLSKLETISFIENVVVIEGFSPLSTDVIEVDVHESL